MKLGEKAPEFSLPGVDGKDHALSDFDKAKALVVVFSCNHCPYVIAYEDRIKAIQSDYGKKGAQVVAINANDAQGYPEDSFEKMVARAKERGFNFPYLRDQEQSVAKAYGASHTPHLFVFDAARKLAYTGKIDDQWQDESKVQRRFLRDALDDILAGRAPTTPETHAIGCTIKWK